MNLLILILGIPLFGSLLMAAVGHKNYAGWLNIGLCVTNFIASIFLVVVFGTNTSLLADNHQFYLDAFNLILIVLSTFIIATTSIFSRRYMWRNIVTQHITFGLLRLYYVMYHFFGFTILLALTTNNLGILWVAIEGATLATVLLVSLYRTPEAIEAAWKYFILCIVGIALALFGTILIYFSAAPVVPIAKNAIFWSELVKYAHLLDPKLVKLAFVFLLVGYGTKTGLVPLHNWLPDAHSESPAPISILLSTLLPSVSLYSLMRFKIVVDMALGGNLTGNLMMGFGLLSFITAAVLMHRQQNIKRLFAYSTIEHMGLIVFAFGLGGKFAAYCAMFYIVMHALTKAAIFVAAGNAIQYAGSHSLDKIRGMIKSQPLVGWGLLIATLAIAGAPPFGIFTSELMLLTITMKQIFWLAIVLLIGFIVAFAACLSKIHPVVYGEASEQKFMHANMFSAYLHLGIVFICGVYLPPFFQNLLHQAVAVIYA